MAENYKLTIAVLESNESLKHDSEANRGTDWLHRETAGVRFEELPSWKFSRGESRYYVLKNVASLLSVRKYDLVLFGGWESPAYWSLLAFALMFRVPRVAFYESPLNTMAHTTGPIAWMRSTFFRFMDLVVVPGVAAAEAVRHLGVQPEKVIQGFNAVDVTEFHNVSPSHVTDNSVSNGMGHRYLYVGQLIQRKRTKAIIEAFNEIATAEDELTIIGSGPLREELLLMAGSNESQIRLLEYVEYSALPRVMSFYHTLILASEREVWGLVVNEALASGMHAVVTENCGVLPSVQGMAGVYAAQLGLQDLAVQMKRSATDWNGRIESPEILQFTPERFAEVFDRAFKSSLEIRGHDNSDK
ncbi:glycosyltransferase family 4 protein [Pseudarthrobacter raffinosi]|uniref:glycosyltransferase family 4 protein n=1 Tax=Pseudarthrobacter raffinosi TaxID=2953651 RepID=UPI00208F0C08|nr:glycosyltransferase family 4 protein [Pseudarthrobacter sp. MDT3-9]MCO4253147.1 glycosyltransferase family 4 protein [Pseudarthrobacter sp. MDT3-9]